MSEENKAVVRRTFEEMWDKGNLGIIDELYADDFVNHNPPPGLSDDRDGFRMFVGMYTSAFPNTTMTIEDQIAEGDRVVPRWVAVGKQEGELMGIPPTGQEVRVTGIGINRVVDGKIVENWGEFDGMGLMQQLGVVPMPGEGG